jgi:hypothetical protein
MKIIISHEREMEGKRKEFLRELLTIGMKELEYLLTYSREDVSEEHSASIFKVKE